LAAAATSQLTGYDIKTVTKYFNEFYGEVKKSQRKNFLERQEEERLRELACNDFLMAEEFENYDIIKDEINKTRKNNEAVPEYLLKKRSESIRIISMLNEKRGSIAMSLPLEDDLRNMIKELMEDVRKE
jgi:hypothetical protein